MKLIERLFCSGFDRRRGRSAPNPKYMNNTETYSEPCEVLPEADWRSTPDNKTGGEALMIHFLFLHGQPGPRGFLFDDKSVREVFVAGETSTDGIRPTAA
jgi:hypothetical protein